LESACKKLDRLYCALPAEFDRQARAGFNCAFRKHKTLLVPREPGGISFLASPPSRPGIRKIPTFTQTFEHPEQKICPGAFMKTGLIRPEATTSAIMDRMNTEFIPNQTFKHPVQKKHPATRVRTGLIR
jgi:hypothetical protein